MFRARRDKVEMQILIINQQSSVASYTELNFGYFKGQFQCEFRCPHSDSDILDAQVDCK